jgi:hypothetical protein
MNCENLIKINQPTSLNEIGESVFYGCLKLKNKEIWKEKCFKKPRQWWEKE